MNNILLDEARELLMIDKHSLDIECQTQADIFFNVSENAVLVVSKRDAAKEFMSQEDARVANSIRIHAEKAGEKLTEAKLQQMITTHPDHIQVTSDYMKAKLEADNWNILKESFLMKASMLKELCALYINKYYSDIEIKGDKNTSRIEVESVRQKLSEKRKTRG